MSVDIYTYVHYRDINWSISDLALIFNDYLAFILISYQKKKKKQLNILTRIHYMYSGINKS